MKLPDNSFVKKDNFDGYENKKPPDMQFSGQIGGFNNKNGNMDQQQFQKNYHQPSSQQSAQIQQDFIPPKPQQFQQGLEQPYPQINQQKADVLSEKQPLNETDSIKTQQNLTPSDQNFEIKEPLKPQQTTESQKPPTIPPQFQQNELLSQESPLKQDFANIEPQNSVNNNNQSEPISQNVSIPKQQQFYNGASGNQQVFPAPKQPLGAENNNKSSSPQYQQTVMLQNHPRFQQQPLQPLAYENSSDRNNKDMHSNQKNKDVQSNKKNKTKIVAITLLTVLFVIVASYFIYVFAFNKGDFNLPFFSQGKSQEQTIESDDESGYIDNGSSTNIGSDGLRTPQAKDKYRFRSDLIN